MAIVADYIIAQQKKGVNKVRSLKDCHKQLLIILHLFFLSTTHLQHSSKKQRSPCTTAQDKLEGSAGGKGTGGTDLMKFLKPIRDNCGDRY